MFSKLIKIFLVLTLFTFTATVFASNLLPHTLAKSGAVYIMTNDPNHNEIVMFERPKNGILLNKKIVPTQGKGSGGMLDPLGSQNSLLLSKMKKWLLAVNAGSDQITIFSVHKDKLVWSDIVASQGKFPVSLTQFHDLVYVLNQGENNMGANVSGFRLTKDGKLTPISNSTRQLPPGGYAQLMFDPLGISLVLTDKVNNAILVYAVHKDGLLDKTPVISQSNGKTPFGFTFDFGRHLIVSEAGSGAVSTYYLKLKDNTLKVISPSVANHQRATCWVAENMHGFTFTSNAASNNISAYKVFAETGHLKLLNEIAGLASTPLDLAMNPDGKFLYVLSPGDRSIHMFKAKLNGRLEDMGIVNADISIYAQGIAVR